VKWKSIAICLMAQEKSEYEWMDSKNMHAHFILKILIKRYNFKKQTSTWRERNYNLQQKA
jgi:hypothetical protein